MILIFITTVFCIYYAAKKHNENIELKALVKTQLQALTPQKITLTDAVKVCKAHGHNIYDTPDELPVELTEIKSIVTQILEQLKMKQNEG